MAIRKKLRITVKEQIRGVKKDEEEERRAWRRSVRKILTMEDSSAGRRKNVKTGFELRGRQVR